MQHMFFVQLYSLPSIHIVAMSFKAIAISLSLLWRSSVALPAGPGFWPNGTSPITTSDVHASAAYSLIDTYDASNWLSKFNVQAVCGSIIALKLNSNTSADPRSNSYVI